MKILATLLFFAVSASAQVRELPVSSPLFLPAEGRQSSPIAASNGTDFFVAWSDTRGGIMGTRITHDGVVLNRTGSVIAAYGDLAAVLWCGGAYLVVIRPDNTSTAIVRLDADGKVIEGPHVVVRNGYVRAAATNGSHIIIVADDIAVLDDHGELIERVALPISSSGAYAWTAVSNGSTFELAVSIYEGVRNSVVAIALDANGHPQRSLFYTAYAQQPLVAVTGGSYRVLFDDLANSKTISFDTSTDPAPANELINRVNSYAAIGTESGYLLAAKAYGDGEMEVIHASGDTVLDARSFVTSAAPASPSEPSFASAGRNVLFVWRERGTDDGNLRGVILDSSGRAESAAFDVTASATAQQRPAIATGAANDLVAWEEKTGIYAARVTPEGVPLDGRGIFISEGFRPQVVFDGDSYVVALLASDGWSVKFRWIDAATGTLLASAEAPTPCLSDFHLGRDGVGLVLFATNCLGRLSAHRITVAGPTGPEIFLTPDGVSANGVTAVCNGLEWLVVWNELTSRPSFTQWPHYLTTMKAARLLVSLSTVDSQPMEIAVSDPYPLVPLVATDGTDFLVAWSEAFGSSSLAPGVYARSVTRGGALGNAILLAAGDDTVARSVAWDGSRYAVAYAVRRDESFLTYNLMLTHTGAADPLAISATSPDQPEGVLAAAPGRPIRVAYDRIATEPAYGGVSRVFIRDLVYARRRLAPH